MIELIWRLEPLFSQGGLILWLILVASLLLWALIAERYWFLWLERRPLRRRIQAAAQTPGLPRRGLARRRYLDGLAATYTGKMRRSLGFIRALTGALPMLGLLGTVTGMIKVFDVMTVFGTGNVRGMAGGISEALITTMAGLVVALSGLFVSADLDHRVEQELDHLNLDDDA